MRVLKRKYFKSTIQLSNRPTMKSILKCNSLLYSSIYSYLNYIYILRWRWCVGCCWTCWIARFQQSNNPHPTKNGKKYPLLDVLDVLLHHFFLVNLCN